VTESDPIIQAAHYGGDQMPWAEYVIAGKIIFLSGAEGRDMARKQEYPDGEPAQSPVYEGVEAQTRACLEKILERVIKAGSKPERRSPTSRGVSGPRDGHAHRARGGFQSGTGVLSVTAS
jgi:enamine deaminase RidA (YjgF/YER057c/UK114 family)